LYNLSSNKQIRLLGVRVDNLVEKEEMQLSIFKLQQTNSEADKQEKGGEKWRLFQYINFMWN